MDGSQFLGAVDCRAMHVEYNLDLSNTQFGGGVDSGYSVVVGDVLMRDAQFPLPAKFNGLRTGGNLVIEGASFAAEADFSSVN
jgi:hypothetical protein